jgi:hypothetical protein
LSVELAFPGIQVLAGPIVPSHAASIAATYVRPDAHAEGEIIQTLEHHTSMVSSAIYLERRE